MRFLREEKLFGDGDPLFPATRMAVGASQQFEVAGLDRKRWSNAGPIRTIFRDAFESAGLPYFHPHSLRKTLVKLGQEVCHSPEEFKAWSQNMGHEQVLTTFTSYGAVRQDRQGEILRKLGLPSQSVLSEADAIAEAVLRKFQGAGVNVPRES